MGEPMPLDCELAAHIMRVVDSGDELAAAVLSPMAGTRPIKLDSLASAESFLIPRDGDSVFASGVRATVNHVEPRMLATWVRDTIGDPDLAEALDALVASGMAYGFLVPDIKRVLAERIEQCEKVMAPGEGTEQE